MPENICLYNFSICGVQHIQRASSQLHLNLFDSIYFVIVTFSTVGYGDISPDIWPSQVFMILMICIAFAFIPMQVSLIFLYFIMPPSKKWGYIALHMSVGRSVGLSVDKPYPINK